VKKTVPLPQWTPYPRSVGAAVVKSFDDALRLRETASVPVGAPGRLAFSHDGRVLAVSTSSDTTFLDGSDLTPLGFYDSPSVAFAATGDAIAFPHAVLRLGDAKPLRTFTRALGDELAFSPDGTHLLSHRAFDSKHTVTEVSGKSSLALKGGKTRPVFTEAGVFAGAAKGVVYHFGLEQNGERVEMRPFVERAGDVELRASAHGILAIDPAGRRLAYRTASTWEPLALNAVDAELFADGERALVYPSNYQDGDTRLEIWSLRPCERLVSVPAGVRRFGAFYARPHMAVAPKGDRVAVAFGCFVYLLDAKDLRVLHRSDAFTFGCGHSLWSAARAHDLINVTRDQVSWLDLGTTKTTTMTTREVLASTEHLAVVADDDRDTHAAVVIDLRERRRLMTLVSSPRRSHGVSSPVAAAVSHDDGEIALCDASGVYLFDTETRALIASWKEERVEALGFAADRRLVTCAAGGVVRVRRGTEIAATTTIESGAAMQVEGRFVVIRRGARATVLSVNDLRELCSLDHGDEAVQVVSVSADGAVIWTLTSPWNVIRCWNIEGGAIRCRLQLPNLSDRFELPLLRDGSAVLSCFDGGETSPAGLRVVARDGREVHVKAHRGGGVVGGDTLVSVGSRLTFYGGT
jgi:hypothetical protein